MTKKEAIKKSLLLYGPLGMAVRAGGSPCVPRKQRFRVGYVSRRGAQFEVVFAGAGGTWEEAFESAKANPAAKTQMQEIQEQMKDLGKFSQDPEKYIKELMESEAAKILEEIDGRAGNPAANAGDAGKEEAVHQADENHTQAGAEAGREDSRATGVRAEEVKDTAGESPSGGND